jgi:uncharacterized membrane protein YhhN
MVFTLLGQVTAWDALPGALLLTVGAVFYALIRPNLGRLRAPVIAYMLAISVTVGRAASTWVGGQLSRQQAFMIVAGTLPFYLSDVALAANRFWRHWKYRRVGLAPYYAAQLLFALTSSRFAT